MQIVLELLSLAVGALLWGGLVIFLGRVLLLGLLTGRIAHTDSSSFCDKNKNPFFYWFLVSLFSVFLLASIYVWVKVAYDILKH